MSAIDANLPRVRPSAWWYLLLPLVLCVGFGLAVAAGIDEARSIVESFDELGADGTGTIELAAGEEGTVWAVWDDGRSTDGLVRPDAIVEVTAPNGEAVAFDDRDSSNSTTFSSGSGTGIDVGTFTAPVDGRYEVQVTWQAAGAGGPVPTAAVGHLDLSSTVERVVRPILLSIAAAVALLVLLLTMRGRSKRRRARLAGGIAIDSPPPPSSLPEQSPQSRPSSGTSGHTGPFV